MQRVIVAQFLKIGTGDREWAAGTGDRCGFPNGRFAAISMIVGGLAPKVKLVHSASRLWNSGNVVDFVAIQA